VVTSAGKTHLVGIALLSMATLGYELTQIRVFAYSLHPVVAFSAIALAMLGFGLGATLLAIRPSWGEACRDGRIAWLCLAFSGSIVLVNAHFARTSTGIVAPGSLAVDPWWTALVLLPAVVPYLLAGAVVAMILSAQVGRTGRVYFWNLLGSAAGCVGMLLLLRPIGAQGLLLVSAGVSAVAAAVMAPTRVARAVAMVTAAAMLALFPLAGRIFPLRSDDTGYNAMFERWERRQGYAPPVRELDEWDPVGRLEVLRHQRATISVPEEIGYRVMTVDGGAMTLLLEEPDAEGWGAALFEESIYGAAYHLHERPDVLVIGVGGGSDVEAALHWDAARVVGVEISRSTLDAVTGRYAGFARWPRDPRVEMIHSDGRSYAKSTDRRFDIVQLSGVDTVTSHASGSMVTVEDYLYTVEAFTDFLDLLEPGGTLSVVRFGDESMNLSLIATKALRSLGVESPHRCIAAFRQEKLSGVLVRRDPFTAKDVAAMRRFTARATRNAVDIPHYDVGGIELGAPIQMLHPPGGAPAPRYRIFFNAVRKGNEEAVARSLGSAFKVPVDDRPYYMLGMWAKAIRGTSGTHPSIRLLLVSTIIIAAASLILIVLPIFAVRRRSGAGPGAMASISLFFFGLGASFMLMEVGLIHQAMVFVGTPGASVAVVLASILVSSGLGSLFSGRLRGAPVRTLLVALLGVLAFGMAYRFGAPAAFDALFPLPVWGRCACAAVIIAPVGFFMGWLFPTGLAITGARLPGLLPWAIAVNAFASVIGSLATFFLGIGFGFSGVFVVALAGYCVAVAAFLPTARSLGR